MSEVRKAPENIGNEEIVLSEAQQRPVRNIRPSMAAREKAEDDLYSILSIEEHEFDRQDLQSIPLALVQPNPYQPRKTFDPEKIVELAQSIKTYGLLQPVIVRKIADRYELVAGERRFRAGLQLGWTEIPAFVKELSENAMATVALIENLQRENLSFLEEAAGYERLLKDFGLTQEVLAQRLGKNQSTIANKLRILRLPGAVKQRLTELDLSERHARALLKLPDEAAQIKILQEIANLGYTVKQTENRVDEYVKKLHPQPRERKKVIIHDIRIFLNQIRQAVSILERGGLGPQMKEVDCGGHLEIHILVPKKKAKG